MKNYEKDYLFMIEQAMKAPSGHNTQPWLFRINRDSIEIHPDITKTLPVVDADRRELFVSLGCATENLCIATRYKGYTPIVSTSENGIITIGLDAASHTQDTMLYKEISRRQTNRSVYNGTLIPDKTMQELLSVTPAGATTLHCWRKDSKEFEMLRNYILQGNKIQMSDSSFKEELKHWMRFNRKHTRQTGDGLSYAVFGAPNLPKWLSRFIMGMCLTPKTQNGNDRKKIASSSHFVLFATRQNTPEAWVDLGRTLERFLLSATKNGIATAFTNQPCELTKLSEKMQKEIPGLGATIPVVLLRIGYSNPMPFSLRKDIDRVILKN